MYGIASTDEKPGIMKFIYHGMPSFRSKDCLPSEKIGMDYIYEKTACILKSEKSPDIKLKFFPHVLLILFFHHA